jgi:hypothetical protein
MSEETKEKDFELKTCPHCGGEAEWIADTARPDSHNCGYVRCVKCHCQSKNLIKHNSIRFWNTRPELNIREAQERRIEEMGAFLKEFVDWTRKVEESHLEHGTIIDFGIEANKLLSPRGAGKGE